MINSIILGDCLEKLKELPENSVDSIVTDPPYELGFMGKSWDNTGVANNKEMWAECLRVLKPGGHLLAFSGTRTYHRMAVAIEDAGFDIRDQIAWCYGQGFPKSLNISLQIKKKYNIGLCTCNVFEPMLELGYENSNNKRDNISNGEDDRLCSSKQIQYKRDDNNEMAEQIKDTNLSPDNAFRKESGVCELSEKDNKKEQGFEKVSESILQSEVCKPISEKERLGNTTLRSGLEENKTTGEREGQSMSDMQNETTDGIAGSSLNTVQNGGQELDGELGGSLSQLPQQDRENNRKRVEQIKNDCNTEEWNNLSRFICSKCYCLKKDIGGTALKPSIEPICMARKPLAEKTVAENCLKWGTGGINIDESRVETKDKLQVLHGTFTFGGGLGADVKGKKIEFIDSGLGRFPANLILDNSEEVRDCFPETKSNGEYKKTGDWKNTGDGEIRTWDIGYDKLNKYAGQEGNASRFFKSVIYQAKSSKSERNKGLDSIVLVDILRVWNENNTTKEEKLIRLMVTGISPKKVIGESGVQLKNANEWNTCLFGKHLMEKYQEDIKSITKTETNSITTSQILNWLIHLLTKEYTVGANLETGNGGNLVENAENSNTLIITISEAMALALGVKDVVSGTQLKINVKEGSNIHSTVKPIALMEYLIKMVTPKGGIVLDPFAGSGTTLVAAKENGYQYIGIEMTPEYIPIIEARLKNLGSKQTTLL